jgi:hypothetical protein
VHHQVLRHSGHNRVWKGCREVGCARWRGRGFQLRQGMGALRLLCWPQPAVCTIKRCGSVSGAIEALT